MSFVSLGWREVVVKKNNNKVSLNPNGGVDNVFFSDPRKWLLLINLLLFTGRDLEDPGMLVFKIMHLKLTFYPRGFVPWCFRSRDWTWR